MSLYTLSPQPWLIFLDDAGVYLPNGQLAIYVSGTSTPATVYTSANGTAHPFPITLDATGRVPGGLYLQPGLSYKFVLHAPQIEEPLDGGILKSQDPVEAVPRSGGASLSIVTGGDYTNLNVSGVNIIEYTGAGDIHIRGMVGGVPGQSISIRNLSPSGGVVWLHYGDSAAAPGGQLLNRVQSGPVPITNSLGTASYIYLSSGIWGMQDYSMGGLIGTPFDPANYVTRDSAIWTVEQNDLYAEGFYIEGRLMSYQFFYQNTSLSIETGALLRQMPFGWQAGYVASTNLVWALNGGPLQAGSVQASNPLQIGFIPLPTAPWPAGVNHLTLVGQIAIPLV